MPRALQVCPCRGCAGHDGSCPDLVTTGRCTTCARTADKARGTKQQRGYGKAHDRLRAQWRPRVERGEAECHAITCLEASRTILPAEPWDLGHTEDRSGWTGPEHSRCNRAAGGRAAHR